MKKVVISGYYGCDNFGDEMILDILVAKLKELNFDITVFSKNPQKTASIHEVKSFETFSLRDVISNLKKTDCLISGGGSLLQDVTSIKSLIYYLFVIAIALFFRKKVIIFAQGIGPIKNKFAEILTMILLKQCEIVTVRDEKSLELVKKFKIDAKLVSDPFYSMRFESKNSQSKVGVQLRAFETLNDKLLNKLAEAICLNFSEKKIQIFSLQTSLDLDVCKKFEGILKTLNPEIKTEIIFDKSPKEIIDEISTLEYMIAMRFHACVTALKFGIKTLAICYDIKLENLVKEAKIPSLSMSAKEDYNEVFEDLKNTDINSTCEIINSKAFDWGIFNLG